MTLGPLLPDNLDEHRLPPSAVKLAVEDPLPRAKAEPAVGHGDHHFAAHHAQLGKLRSASGARRHSCHFVQDRGLPEASLAGAVVPVLLDRRVRCQPFEPHLAIVMQAALVVVDKHRRGNVHRIYKGQYPLYRLPLSCP
jgi:hypothetical protein